MRAWAWVAVGLALTGPAVGQSSDFAKAVDTLRGTARIISYANRCIRDPDRLERVAAEVVRLVRFGMTEEEGTLLRFAMSIELVYYDEIPNPSSALLGSSSISRSSKQCAERIKPQPVARDREVARERCLIRQPAFIRQSME